MIDATTTHSLERTSPKGGPFVGTCRLCGKEGLTAKEANDFCTNPRRTTWEQALLQALHGGTER
jgi:hypothetical protein